MMREDLINHVLDLEAEGRTSAARAMIAKASAEDPGFASDLRETRAGLADLTAPAWTPDLSESILWAVEARRPFLPKRSVRRMTGTKMAVACGMLAALMVAGVLHRFSGSSFNSEEFLGPQASREAMTDDAMIDATQSGTLAAGVLGVPGSDASSSLASVDLSRHSTLPLGDVSRYSMPSGDSRGLVMSAPSSIYSGQPGSMFNSTGAGSLSGSGQASRDRLASSTYRVQDSQTLSQRPGLLRSTNSTPVTTVIQAPILTDADLEAGRGIQRGVLRWSWPGLIDGQSLLRGLSLEPAKVTLPLPAKSQETAPYKP